jgi:hypothetical protein
LRSVEDGSFMCFYQRSHNEDNCLLSRSDVAAQ